MVETAWSPWTPPLPHPPKSSQVGNMVLLFQPLLSPASALHCYYLCLSSASSHLPRNHLHSCGPQASRLLCPWNFPGKNTGAGCHFLLQGFFPTQGSNPRLLHLLHCRQIVNHWAIWEALRNPSPFLIHCLWFLRFWDKVHNYCSQKKRKSQSIRGSRKINSYNRAQQPVPAACGGAVLTPAGGRQDRSQRKGLGTDIEGWTEAQGKREVGMGSQATRAAKERGQREGHARWARSSLTRLDSVRCEK